MRPLRWWLKCITATSLTFFILYLTSIPNSKLKPVQDVWDDDGPTRFWRNLSKQQVERMSTLGRYLFLDEEPPKPKNRSFTILVWKYGKTIEQRHIYHYTKKKHDPFEKCSAKNCKLTYDDEKLASADAVIFHLHRLKGAKDLPQETARSAEQRWIFLSDEAPLNTFLDGKTKMKDFNGKFNWSMTYRTSSDVPVPYGRTVLVKNITEFEIPKHKRSDVLVAIMGSNCGGGNHRWNYVHELEKHIKIDVYGHCGKLKCAGHFDKDCDKLLDYKFYLSFENSNCDEYVTEKVWWNAYSKNAIPIVMGCKKRDYEQLLPPRSYINIEDYATPGDLARHILYINKTEEEYKQFFQWKRYFRISNEHGYFQTDSYHYCRVCEALNYNSEERRVYKNLEKYWSKQNCYPRWDAGRKTTN